MTNPNKKYGEGTLKADGESFDMTEISYSLNGKVRTATDNGQGFTTQTKGGWVMPDGRSAQVKIEDGWHISKSEEADDKYELDFSFKKIDSDKASVGKGFYFTKQKAADIVSQLVSGYPVEFVNQSVNDVVLPAFVVSATDKIEKVINRLARLSDTLIYSDDAGRLVMADKCRDKYTASALITGENIIDIYKNDNVYKAYETVTLHSQLPLADAYSLDNIISSPVSGKSQGSGRQYHQTVDIASPSRLNAAISELEYDCYDLKVTGSSFRTTDDKLYQLNSALKIKDPWIELNDSFLITDVDLTSGQNGCRAALNLEKMV